MRLFDWRRKGEAMTRKQFEALQPGDLVALPVPAGIDNKPLVPMVVSRIAVDSVGVVYHDFKGRLRQHLLPYAILGVWGRADEYAPYKWSFDKESS